MRIDLWADVVCPWCYLGAARLDKAIAGFPHRDEVEVVHRSFELDPSASRGRVEPVLTMLTNRFGAGGAAADEWVAALARSEGLVYRTDRQVGSTLDAHRLLHLARSHGLQRRLTGLLFEANFAQATSIFTTDALVGLADQAGVEPAEARATLSDPDAYLSAVRADEREALDRGAGGVPFTVIDDRIAVAGSQPTETFAAALATAWAQADEGR